MSSIILNSFIRINKKPYSQILLKECKHELKKNKMENLTNDYLELSSSHESDNESDNESNNESNDWIANEPQN